MPFSFADEARSVSHPEDPVSKFDDMLWNAQREAFLPTPRTSRAVTFGDAASSPLNHSCARALEIERAVGDWQDHGSGAVIPAFAQS